MPRDVSKKDTGTHANTHVFIYIHRRQKAWRGIGLVPLRKAHQRLREPPVAKIEFLDRARFILKPLLGEPFVANLRANRGAF